MLAKYVLAENAFFIPKEYLVNLTSDPYDFVGGFQTFPVKDRVSSIQKATVSYLFSPGVLSRISNNEYKAKDYRKALTLPEVFLTSRKAVWSELSDRRNIGVLHRQLQRAHLETLFGLVLNTGSSVPDDARILAWNDLRELKKSLAFANLGTNYDTYTKLHLEEAAMRVNRVLDAKLTITTGGGGAARPLTLADLLGGETAK